MSKELLQAVIDGGVRDNLNTFFLDASNSYRELDQSLSAYDDDRFSDLQAIGEIVFDPAEKLVVVTAELVQDLTERSGKKAQYEKAKRILKDYMKYDAGIFVFSDEAGSFRFSLVYGQAQGTRRAFSNFRRFTYFVSRDQTNRTYLTRVGECTFSSLAEVKEAFSVEKVNKEFYREIANFYYRLTGRNGYQRDLVLPYVAADDDGKYEQFAVRLIGRAIFCWFLKHKKSPNGVPLMPQDVLSVSAVHSYPNYYHSILEPIFFQLMNKPLRDRNQVAVPEADRIPFLNGGLFEPHANDYYQDAPNWGLKIPDSWFADFFAVLEQYNFTIDENSVVDADVSVDPEMMGRIFENLLAEVNPETGDTARKATGSYYTPRAIVDYMVEQSLIQYLLGKTALPGEKLNRLLSYEEDVDDFTDEDKNSVVIALKDIKTIDPACGSGAFPMGILHRMLLALEKVDPKLEMWRRQYLNSYHPVMRRIIEDKLRKGNEEYIRKLTTIQDSIYGVDIQPIAVEIAKLRCFLSLIVDERVFDDEDNRGVEPLPNLEFKFVAANTLIGLPDVVNKQIKLAVSGTIEHLRSLRNQYLSCYPHEKQNIISEFRATQRKLYQQNVEWMLSDAQASQLTEWDPFSYESCSWFEPEWMFGVSDGFDVVMANPPYIRQEKIKELKPALQKQYACYTGVADIYVYFYERGFQLLKDGGILTYISSNKYFRSGYGQKLRHFLGSRSTLCQVIDFGDAPVFEAISYPSIIIVKKAPPDGSQARVLAWKPGPSIEDFASVFHANSFYIAQSELTEDGWRLESPAALRLLEKLRRAGKPLGEYVNGRFYRGILTGLNEAFVVDRATRDRLIAEHPSSAEVLKPFLRGKDVKRWSVEFADQYLIKIESSDNRRHPWSGKPAKEAEKVFASTYPAIHDHLQAYRERLTKRDDQGKYFWELRSCVYWHEFEQHQIVWGNMATKPKFAFAGPGLYLCAPAVTMIADSKYLLGILNSTVTRYLVWQSAAGRQGGYVEYKPMYISPLAIPEQSESEGMHVCGLVGQILEIKRSDSSADVSALEREIDELVCDLYGLSTDEIKIIEDACHKPKPVS